MSFRNYQVPYAINDQFKKKAAYFSMEFAIHQPLKIYSGGLGFLAGSHLRSAYELKQNMIGSFINSTASQAYLEYLI
jgi:starch phosphorylase